MDIRNISRAAALMREAQGVLGAGSFDFYLRELAACYNLLMQRFAPYKVGDRVALTRAPDFENAPGWAGCKHFLVKGAAGIVREATCGEGGFRFGIEFDNDTWLDTQGKKQTTISKGMFMFGEDDLRPTGDCERE